MTSQPLKWHGGKFYLAPWIIENMPPHLHYVEPYFGGGAVLFRKPQRDWMVNCPHCGKNDQIHTMLAGESQRLMHGCRRCKQAGAAYQLAACYQGCSEAVNDINGELMNFWSVLQSEDLFTDFVRFVGMKPFSEVEFKDAKEWSGAGHATDEFAIEAAATFFVRYRQSRQGLGRDFATMVKTRTRRRMQDQVSAWLSAIDGLPEAHERLKRVAVFNRPALDVIKQQDGPSTVFYLDPPYLHETRHGSGKNREYEHEMTATEHEQLLHALYEIKGKFLLSGYFSDLYGDCAEVFGWRRIEKQIDKKSSSLGVKPKSVECLWMNF